MLAQAIDPRTPLLDRPPSAIFNNLDEFFMVRVASLSRRWKQASPQRRRQNPPGTAAHHPREADAPTTTGALRLHLKQQLQQHQVQLLDYDQLNARQRQWVDDTFQTSVFPVLTPLAVIRLILPIRQQPEHQCGGGDS